MTNRTFYTSEQLTNEDYHARSELSSSALKVFSKCPHYYQYEWLPTDSKKPPSNAMEFGTLVHTMCLEPHLMDHYFIFDGTRQAKAYKEAPDPKTTLSDHGVACRIQSAYLESPEVRAILPAAEVEKSVTWTDEATGIECRARADIIHETGGVIDLKTCQDVFYFKRDMRNFKYYLQAGFYMEGFGVNHFSFIAVEKTAPYRSRLFDLDPEAVAACKQLYRDTLDDYAHCVKHDHWPRKVLDPVYISIEDM